MTAKILYALFYRIDLTDFEDSTYCYLKDEPDELFKDSIGYGLSIGESQINKYPQKPVQAKMHDTRGGLVLTERLANSDSHLIVSKKLKNIIANFDNNGDIEFFPLGILDRKNRLASDDYFYVNPLGTFDCLDQHLSKVSYHRKKVIGVDKMVLSPEKLKSAPCIFRLTEEPQGIFISLALANALASVDSDVHNLGFHVVEIAPKNQLQND